MLAAVFRFFFYFSA
ncbi:pheST operon leader peptide PheM [Pantoea eucrina]|uniref:pheST attenuator peptide n=1 Tax=Pantoea eucrina TaxID=472693 RepID=A0ABU5LF94_9GAMM|nr:pheST operon leader peptide PheM [Pantoea eucrina]MDZ7278625.1 pheST operon leader peptide PheM [Pantoea eucrina]